MGGFRSVDGNGDGPSRSAKRRTRRELLRLAGRTPDQDDSGQRRDDEFAARLVALVNAGVLSRRELLQLSAAGGFLAFLEQHGGLVRLIEATGPPVRQLPAAIEAGPDGEIDIDRSEALPQQQRADPIIAPTFTASAFRREDMLTLDFEFFNLVLVGTNLVKLQPLNSAYIVAKFAVGNDPLPQHVAEESFFEPGGVLKAPGTIEAGRAGTSRLAFRLPDGVNSIPFTLDALLDWANFEQSVVPYARPPVVPRRADPFSVQSTGVAITAQGPAPGDETVIVDPDDFELVPPEIRFPRRNETALEVPWRLIVSPSNLAGWAHANKPVTHGDVTELWHTRLGVRGERPDAPGTFGVDERAAFYRTLRAIWTSALRPGRSTVRRCRSVRGLCTSQQIAGRSFASRPTTTLVVDMSRCPFRRTVSCCRRSARSSMSMEIGR